MSRKLLILTALEMEAKALAPVAGPTEVRVIGIRAVRLTPKTIAGADTLILAGLAGALDSRLRVGEVVMQKFGDWPDLPYRSVEIHTSDHPITDPREKARLFAQTAAPVVDMETAVVQRAASVPLLVLRAISDTAADALPPGMMDCIDDIGRPRKLKFAAAVLKQPGLMGILKRLERDSRTALAALADALRKVIQKLPP
jgi:adenosylhomocysteine nucleosidase